MSKIFENVFRAVNISLVNEIKELSKKLDIDFNEVVNLAATKPFGFMKFEPGIGADHCIPIGFNLFTMETEDGKIEF